MDAQTEMLLWLAWTLIAFLAGVAVHWYATRKQRRLLKQYRQREQARRWVNRIIE